jgi:hypothetical protein
MRIDGAFLQNLGVNELTHQRLQKYFEARKRRLREEGVVKNVEGVFSAENAGGKSILNQFYTFN